MEQPVQPTIQAVSSGKRFMNLAIDTVLYEILMLFIINPLIRLVFGKAFTANFWGNWMFALLIMFLYYFVFELVFQKTPAKFITGTKVVLDDGSKPNASAIAKRTLTRLVPFEAVSMYTGKELEKKGTWWHDRWTATRVIKS
jgi:uncharacterized RDD family membrane protein YckC